MQESGSSSRKKWVRTGHAATLVSVVALSMTATIYFGLQARCPGVPPINARMVQFANGPGASTVYRYERLANPGRTVVREGSGAVLATFTDGARTAVLAGPARVFLAYGATSSSISSDSWVRLIPLAWGAAAERAAWFRPWLDSALADRSPDALAVAMDDGLPRDVRAMARSGRGIAVITDPVRPRYDLLQPGDLVFFDLDSKDARPVDRVGVYVGMDNAGHHRFLSGRSLLPLDDGRFSQAFRAARRI